VRLLETRFETPVYYDEIEERTSANLEKGSKNNPYFLGRDISTPILRQKDLDELAPLNDKNEGTERVKIEVLNIPGILQFKN
jgi:hypothetical protein